ncbi:hypothetical protein RHMOL_Rhmol09G0101200 [Rhododendron molle]|uniref:Uncharacterized protein n=1 Tax=Rhododendron molle TaxID=49168 RepID=A0ACC0MCV7_RHOML|nr:hypothetical protein RHMOL_Rhmol09G0101200 [Rhododendron molle]
MKYMKDLIRDEKILSRGNFNGKKTYMKAEIDEVRAEWLFFYGCCSATASVLNCGFCCCLLNNGSR